MSESISRCFKHQDGTLVRISLDVSEDGTFVSLANTHVLVDPSDFNSDVLDGWDEITTWQLGQEETKRYDDAVALSDQRREDYEDAKKSTYMEAIKLGFSEASAATMSGYTPTA